MNIKNRKLFSGFTLIELIVVILILGILSSVFFTIIRDPVTQYVQLEQRTNMVDIAETALLRMTREIRLALPNSVRVTAGATVEFLRTLDGGRYRAKPGGAGPALCGGSVAQDRLRFSQTTDCFEVLGALVNVASIVTGATQANCISSAADCLVIFNTGQAGADAYNGDNLAVITANFLTTNSLEFAGAAPFPFQSPRQRFYVVDTPVSYVCSGSEIRRIDNYSITGGVGAATGDLLVNQVTGCNFTYDPGTASRASLVTLSITITDSNLGQSVTLLQQAHVDNQP
jgi:MSHA biogenesis protein MshO